MLIKHANWRRERDVENITLEDVDLEAKKDYVIPRGTAKCGRPAFWVCVKRHDKNTRDLDVLYKFIVYNVENTMNRCTLEMDERFVLVFDLRAFSMKNMDYQGVKVLVNILQTNYPEVLDRAVIVGSPFFFSACWAVIRPWLDPVTIAKVQFTDYEGVKEYIDESEWPDEFKNSAEAEA